MLQAGRALEAPAKEMLKVQNKRRCKRTRRRHPLIYPLRDIEGRQHPRNPRKKSEDSL
jgi:hypothetical protein